MVGAMLDNTTQSRLLPVYLVFGLTGAGQRLNHIHTLSPESGKGIWDGGWGQGWFFTTLTYPL